MRRDELTKAQREVFDFLAALPDRGIVTIKEEEQHYPNGTVHRILILDGIGHAERINCSACRHKGFSSVHCRFRWKDGEFDGAFLDARNKVGSISRAIEIIKSKLWMDEEIRRVPA